MEHAEQIESFINGNNVNFWLYFNTLNRQSILTLIETWLEIFDSYILKHCPQFANEILHLSIEQLRQLVQCLKHKAYTGDFIACHFTTR